MQRPNCLLSPCTREGSVLSPCEQRTSWSLILHGDQRSLPYFSTDHLPAPRALHANSLSCKRLSSTISPGCLTQACMLVFPLWPIAWQNYSYSLQPWLAPEITPRTLFDGSRVPFCRLPRLEASYHMQKTQQQTSSASAKRTPPFHGQLAFTPLLAAKLPRTRVYLFDYIAHSKLAINSLRTNKGLAILLFWGVFFWLLWASAGKKKRETRAKKK